MQAQPDMMAGASVECDENMLMGTGVVVFELYFNVISLYF
jgi:hypothetical protein